MGSRASVVRARENEEKRPRIHREGARNNCFALPPIPCFFRHATLTLPCSPSGPRPQSHRPTRGGGRRGGGRRRRHRRARGRQPGPARRRRRPSRCPTGCGSRHRTGRPAGEWQTRPGGGRPPMYVRFGVVGSGAWVRGRESAWEAGRQTCCAAVARRHDTKLMGARPRPWLAPDGARRARDGIWTPLVARLGGCNAPWWAKGEQPRIDRK